jgi:hypothetical protein
MGRSQLKSLHWSDLPASPSPLTLLAQAGEE